MSRRVRLGIALCLCTLLVIIPRSRAEPSDPDATGRVADPVGTAFTYQGQLLQDGKPANGTCDFLLGLWDRSSGGIQVASMPIVSDVAVEAGLFTLILDFGPLAFNGSARWLDTAVRCPAGTGSYEALSPRMPVTVVPYALYAKSVPWGGLIGVPPGFADAVDDDTRYTAGEGLALTSTQFGVAFAGSGSAPSVARSDHLHVDSYWQLSGNSGSDSPQGFLGTVDNQALELRVNGARALRLEPDPVSPNVLGGYQANQVSEGVHGAVLAGGGSTGGVNLVTDHYGVVGGGSGNRAGNEDGSLNNVAYATVGGGDRNIAEGSHSAVGGGEHNLASGSHAIVGGGLYNVASGYASTVSGGGGYDDVIGTPLSNTAAGTFSTVGGGISNDASGFAATVGGGESNAASGEDAVIAGGWRNVASGLAATVPGGEGNTAAGDYSLAAGRGARAAHTGAFVWSDSTDGVVNSQRQDQFLVHATGGVRFDISESQWLDLWDAGEGRLLDTSTGAYLSSGGAWTNSSSRALKENLTRVSGAAVLSRLARLPIYTWSYSAEDPATRHVGPTSEGFRTAFGLGQDAAHIATVDADGVALAAAQGLYDLAQQQSRRIEQLEAQNEALQGRLAALEALVAQMAGTNH
jgi:hypothetical protein